MQILIRMNLSIWWDNPSNQWHPGTYSTRHTFNEVDSQEGILSHVSFRVFRSAFLRSWAPPSVLKSIMLQEVFDWIEIGRLCWPSPVKTFQYVKANGKWNFLQEKAFEHLLVTCGEACIIYCFQKMYFYKNMCVYTHTVYSIHRGSKAIHEKRVDCIV